MLPLYFTVENVELTSDRERRFTCPGDLVTFTCRVFGSRSLQWHSPLITQTTAYIACDTPPRSLNHDPFTAFLDNVTGTAPNANFTFTLQVLYLGCLWGMQQLWCALAQLLTKQTTWQLLVCMVCTTLVIMAIWNFTLLEVGCNLW